MAYLDMCIGGGFVGAYWLVNWDCLTNSFRLRLVTVLSRRQRRVCATDTYWVGVKRRFHLEVNFNEIRRSAGSSPRSYYPYDYTSAKKLHG